MYNKINKKRAAAQGNVPLCSEYSEHISSYKLEKIKQELQGYLDAVGAGQQCQEFAYDKTIDPYTPGTVRTIYKAKVDSMDWKIVIVGGKIQAAQANHWKWEA